MGTGEIITITFNATINENAVIDSATGNENKVELDYSNQHSEDKVYVETYDFQLYKTDGTSFLDGAGFKLYDAATGGDQILIADEGNGEYVKDATASADVTIDIDSANGCHVRGLAPGTYYLEEVKFPDGYNPLDERVAVTITSEATAAVEITVENTAGTQLPSTGGIGTTIFYIAGAVLVLGAVAIIIARRKAEQH